MIPGYLDDEELSSDIKKDGTVFEEQTIDHDFNDTNARSFYRNSSTSASQNKERKCVDTLVTDYMKAANVSKL